MLRNNQRNSLRVKQREENDFKKKMIAVEGRDMIDPFITTKFNLVSTVLFKIIHIEIRFKKSKVFLKTLYISKLVSTETY